ncbi:hypothetical protein [Pseudomonas sp. W5-36]|uniref:hypothetical protein n=1 Tax=Pseudomonas sp. W5-36 TaxID=3097455 RepID=UPI00397E1979
MALVGSDIETVLQDIPAPVAWGEDIRWWNFRRHLQVEYALRALFSRSEREVNATLKIWDLGCEAYTPEQLFEFFSSLMPSGYCSFSRLAHELESSIDWRRDPKPDIDFPSVVALCNALRQVVKRRLVTGDFSWISIADAQSADAPPSGSGGGWDDVTSALFSKLKKDAHGPTLDWMFAADLGL